MILIALSAFAAVPESAHADERQDHAEACAIRYEQAVFSQRASAILADFDLILTQDRTRLLIESYGLNELMIGMNAMGTIDSNLVLPLELGLDSDQLVLVEGAVRSLAACDELYGFTPVFAFKPDMNAFAPVAPQVGDFDCAVAFWLLGAFDPGLRQAALARAEFALARHQNAHPGSMAATLGQQVISQGQARGQRIQQGQESADALTADLRACDATYGFAEATRQ